MNAYYQSLIRGAIGGVFTGMATFFGLAPSQGAEVAFYAAGGVFAAYMVARFGEGTFDANTKGKG